MIYGLSLWTTRAAFLSSSILSWSSSPFLLTPSPLSQSFPWWLTDQEAELLRQIIVCMQKDDPQQHRQQGAFTHSTRDNNLLFEPIIDAIGDAEIVLIGEATHGTEEVYRLRADLTKALIESSSDKNKNDKPFDAIICEGDFPLFEDLNHYVGGVQDNPSKQLTQQQQTIQDAFDGFRDRFPVWMWKNDAFVEFVAWLKDFNSCSFNQPVQLLGMDIYSMYRSMGEVVQYLEDTAAVTGTFMVPDVRDRFAILNRFRPDATDYGKAVFYNTIPSQAENVRYVWKELHIATQSNNESPELWKAIENARLVVVAEAFFRQLLISREQHDDGTLWNLREASMFQSLQNIRDSIQQQQRMTLSSSSSTTTRTSQPPRIIVWAHNSHVGDGRATQHGKKRRSPPHINLGQSCRQVFGTDKVFSIGFTINTGTVRAVREWGESDTIMPLQPAIEGSHEYLLGIVASATKQNVIGYSFRSLSSLVNNNNNNNDDDDYNASIRTLLFAMPRIQRFVGVSYAPETELQSHYSTSILSKEFDHVIHVDRSTAVRVDQVEKWKYDHDPIARMLRNNENKTHVMYLLDAFGKQDD